MSVFDEACLVWTDSDGWRFDSGGFGSLLGFSLSVMVAVSMCAGVVEVDLISRAAL